MDEFILKIKKGKTDCDACPFCGGYTYVGDVGEYICNMPTTDIDCNKYDLSTMQISQKIKDAK